MVTVALAFGDVMHGRLTKDKVIFELSTDSYEFECFDLTEDNQARIDSWFLDTDLDYSHIEIDAENCEIHAILKNRNN